MSEIRPLRGEHARIKFLPCPEGATAQRGTIIGEIECPYCDGHALAYVYVGEGGHVYAFHNDRHPNAVPPEITVQCGQPIFKSNRPTGRNITRHWSTQRYSKGTPANVTKKPEPKVIAQVDKQPQPAKPAAKPAAGKRPTAAGGGNPPVDKPAPGKSGGGSGGWWDEQ